MKGKRYTEEEVIRIQGEGESWKTVTAVRGQYSVSDATVHQWRSKYRGMDPPYLKRLRELEAEYAWLS